MTRILIVEDEVSARIACQYQLEALGEVTAVRNVQEALAYIEAASRGGPPVDLAVVDLQMPGPQGFEVDGGLTVMERMQSIMPGAPCIVLTIRNDPMARDRAKQLGNVRFFMGKPWRKADLRDAAERCLAGSASGVTFIDSAEGDDANV